jgi:hypothetical protein
MKFIKATERLPSRPGTYYCRRISNGNKYVYRYGGRASYFVTKPWDIEWLDDEGAISIQDALVALKNAAEAATEALKTFKR